MSFQHPDIKQFLLDSIPGRFAHLTNEEFESFIIYLLELDGYSVELVPKQGDMGSNLLARKDDISMLIRLLRFPPEQQVKEDEIRKADIAKSFYETDQAWIITTSTFEKKAIRAAEKADIEWWDWDVLYGVLSENFFEGKSHLDFIPAKPVVTSHDHNQETVRLKMKVKWQPEEGIEAEWYNLAVYITNPGIHNVYIHLDLPAFIDKKGNQTIADKWSDDEFTAGMLYEGATIKTNALFRATRLGEHPPGGRVMQTVHIRTDTPETQHLAARVKGDACYFVTYCYSRQSPEYRMMRRFRDEILASTWMGNRLIGMYYALSPMLIKYAPGNKLIDSLIRKFTGRVVDYFKTKDKNL